LTSLVIVVQASAGNLQDLLPLQKGHVVATCFSSSTPFDYIQDPAGPVVAVFNGSASELALAPLSTPGGAHPWQSFHNELSVQNPNLPNVNHIWNARNLGEVFGITMDDAANPNIYVAATTVYGNHAYPAGNGPGTVYKLDGATGDITAFNSIPNSGPALGNLTSWKASGGSEHLYVTSFDDGLIYQITLAGALVGTYDHGVDGRPLESLVPLADVPANAYTALGRRVWGIEAHEGRLYYAVWTAAGAEIWSVGLDVAGVPVPATAQRDIPVGSFPNNYPVSDIAFSTTGQMYVAQRYHMGANFGGQHYDFVLEFTFAAGSWNNPSPSNTYRVGDFSSGANSAGGVSVECSGAVWASGDALNYPSPAIYGMTRMPAGGNVADVPASLNCYFVDFDCNTTTVLKSYLGDVEIYDPCEACFDITDLEIECPPNIGDPFTVTFTLTNLSTKTASYIWYTPCPGAQLPAGAITGQPTPGPGPQLLPTALAPGDSTSVTVHLPAPMQGGKFCWRITLLDEVGEECCTDKICVDLPDCDCFIVLDKVINCVLNPDGTYKFTMDITLRNTSPFSWYHVNLLPPLVFSPATFDLSSSPVPPGSNYTVSTCVSANPGDALCFNISVHDENIEVCCSKECCIVLPPCGDVKPDGCTVTRVAPCCPDAIGVPGGVANVTLMICNNSPVSRTYNWDMHPGAVVGPCTGVLSAGAFSPPNGSITIPAYTCLPVYITVSCESLQPGQFACYEACVHQSDNPDNEFCCRGRVYQPKPGEVIVKDDDPAGGLGDPYQLNPSAAGPVRVDLEVINAGEVESSYVFEVRGQFGMLQIASPAATTQGPGEVLRFEVVVPPLSTLRIPLDLFADPGLPFDNSVVPVLVYPLNGAGQNDYSVSSFLTVASRPEGPATIKDFDATGPGEYLLTLQAIPGRTYSIQSSRSLGQIDPWGVITCTLIPDDIATEEFVATKSIIQLRIVPGPDCEMMFYRAIEVP